VNSERELMLEDARSISEGVWRKGRLAQDAAESLDVRIEDISTWTGWRRPWRRARPLRAYRPSAWRSVRSWTPTSSATLDRQDSAKPLSREKFSETALGLICETSNCGGGK